MLSSQDGIHTEELQDFPPKLCQKEWKKFGFRVNFYGKFYTKCSIITENLANSTSDLISKTPLFLKNWTKITGLKKMVCHTLGPWRRKRAQGVVQVRFFVSSYFCPDLKKNWSFGSRIRCRIWRFFEKYWRFSLEFSVKIHTKFASLFSLFFAQFRG